MTVQLVNMAKLGRILRNLGGYTLKFLDYFEKKIEILNNSSNLDKKIILPRPRQFHGQQELSLFLKIFPSFDKILQFAQRRKSHNKSFVTSAKRNVI